MGRAGDAGRRGTHLSPPRPRAIRLGVLARIVRATAAPRGDELARFLATLEAGGVATLGGWRGDARASLAHGVSPPARPIGLK